jgi:hypothetical protein
LTNNSNNMNKIYRIKVEERNNGNVYYIPQVGTRLLTTSVFCYVYTNWENIIHDSKTSKTITVRFLTKESAIKFIDDYKEELEIKNGENITKISYIDIE